MVMMMSRMGTDRQHFKLGIKLEHFPNLRNICLVSFMYATKATTGKCDVYILFTFYSDSSLVHVLKRQMGVDLAVGRRIPAAA
jgi:hypothetical protein